MNKQLDKEIKSILPRINCGWWRDLCDWRAAWVLTNCLQNNLRESHRFPFVWIPKLLRVCATHRLRTVLMELKNHILEITSSNILPNTGIPSRTWLNSHLTLFEHPRNQGHRFTKQLVPAGVLEQNWKGWKARSFFKSHLCCSFMNARWCYVLLCKGCCGSLEEGAWPSPRECGKDQLWKILFLEQASWGLGERPRGLLASFGSCKSRCVLWRLIDSVIFMEMPLVSTGLKCN